MPTAIKFLDGSDDTIEILAFPFGGPFKGRDGDGEYFTAKTDLCLDWFPDQRPLLYHHGLDKALQVEVIGRVDCKSLRTDEDGHWVKAQLDIRHRYYNQVKRLIGDDVLGGSSGSVEHLVKRAKNGHLDRWPWIEQSLTPAPCNPYSVVVKEAAKHYKSLDLEAPDEAALNAHVDPAEAATKAASDSIPAEEANGDSSEGSYEDLIGDIARAANSRFQVGGITGLPALGYAYPVATFPAGGAHQPGYAILRCGGYGDDDDGTGYYRVDFTIGPEGDPVLGSATPMSKVYVPAAKSLAAAITATPLAIAASEAVRQIKALGAQAEAVRERRQAAGRDLGDGSRQHLAALADDLAGMAEAIKSLLRPRAEAAEAPAPRLDDADQRLRLLEAELFMLLAE